MVASMGKIETILSTPFGTYSSLRNNNTCQREYLKDILVFTHIIYFCKKNSWKKSQLKLHSFQLGSMTTNQRTDGTVDLMVSQPGGTYVSLLHRKSCADGESDTTKWVY